MACDITAGRLEPCKDSVGGIIAIYISNYTSGLLNAPSDGGATFVDEEITGFASPLTFYKFDLKGANSFDQTNENSRENGTSFWTQTGTIVLKKQDNATRKEMKLLSYGRPQIIVQDYNGKYYLAGIENGCEVVANTATGAAMGDLNGYNITFTGTEKTPANFISSSIIGDTTNTVIVLGV
jgi:hypothetical protein|tara:strand:- start:3038 stop:3580 length:543 start_codon:yes stop_codon:yes gene_type:complete